MTGLRKCSTVKGSLPSLITGRRGEGTEGLLTAGGTEQKPVADPCSLFTVLPTKHRLAITQASMLAKACSRPDLLGLARSWEACRPETVVPATQ